MGFKYILTVLFTGIVMVLFITYYFMFVLPVGGSEFYVQAANSSIPSYDNATSIQFYPKMRFSEKEISYNISDKCSVKKQTDVRDAFSMIENLTSLSFHSSYNNPQIDITCTSEVKESEKASGFFVAGEGGPTNITLTNNFNVILHGKILLIRDSICDKPNIAIHEILHVLGFAHSNNIGSIMYETTKCNQVVTDDIVELINELYSAESLPDISISNITAKADGRYLDISFEATNHGLKKSGSFSVLISADEKLLEKVEIKSMEVGYGTFVSLKNVRLPLNEIDKITLEAETEFNEINKKNNKVELDVN